MTHAPDVSVVIPTFNRAALLADTLEVLARSRPPDGLSWEVLVVDNNSLDGTASVVAAAQRHYPVPLRYVREPKQGRSHALNAGIAATAAEGLLFLDDDVRVSPEWLAEASAALRAGWHYIGGPVDPRWESDPPVWLDLSRADLWATIAILDYGDQPFEFGRRRRVPLGANMGVRRELLQRVGGFSSSLGRSAGRRLLGQEVPELLARARAVGLTGLYVPGMRVAHLVPTARLTRNYYRRWWFGKGYSRARLDVLQPVTELGLDLRGVRHVGPLPRFLFTDAVRDLTGWMAAALRRDARECVRREMRLAFFVGYVRGRGLSRPAYPALPQAEGTTRTALADGAG